jgi:hypothetical protein
MDQIDGDQEHKNNEESQFVGKHNPYQNGFWTDDEAEIVVLPQKINVYPKEENEEKKVSDEVQATTNPPKSSIQPKLEIKEIPVNETKKVKCVEVEESEKKEAEEKSEDKHDFK